MKNKHTAAAVTLVAIGLAFTLFAAEKRADRTTAETSTPQGSNETFKCEVLKVFSAKEGDALFRAYVVKWKGQEVIASDPLVMSDYHIGDTITVLAMNLPYPNGKTGLRLLHFQVIQTR
jgi:hypothetical protein